MYSRRVSTGVKILNNLLEGGYETDSITTIYGPAGTGKTNLALQAATETAKTGKKTIYIDTEGGFSAHRLKQVQPNHKKLLDKIMFYRPTKFEDQHKIINKLQDIKAGLIIIDTINMLYRLERRFKEEDTHNHQLGLQLRALNEIARTKHTPILLTSQIYQGFDGKIKIVGGDIIAYTSKCLIELQNNHGQRKMILQKHRSIPQQETKFTIKEKGIEEQTIPQ